VPHAPSASSRPHAKSRPSQNAQSSPGHNPHCTCFFQVTALCKLFYVSCFAGGSTRPRPWFTLRWTIFHNFSCRLAHSQEDTTSSYRIIAAHFDGPFSTICFSSPRALSRGHNIILPKIQTLAAHFDGTFSTIVLVASRTLKRVQTTQHLTASTAKCHRGAPRALGLVQCLCTGRWHARGPS